MTGFVPWWMSIGIMMFVGGQVWISLREWPEDRPEISEDIARVIGFLLALLWPATATIAALWFPLVYVPKWVQNWLRLRRERVARAEVAAKLAADEAHYPVERGAHR